MKTRTACLWFGLTAVWLGGITSTQGELSFRPENLARKARITANSEYSGQYGAPNVANRQVPEEGNRQDKGIAWCVNGDTHKQGATITFFWNAPVTIAEVVYYGRTAWYLEECWKDYEVFVDGGSDPVASGRFAMRHGAQRIRLSKPVDATKMSLKFTSSYNGFNPGASEIQIFPRSPTETELNRHVKSGSSFLKEVDVAKLRALIGELKDRHGKGYRQAEEHLARLNRLEEEAEEELMRLQREVLLFDVRQLLVIKRHEINPTHVYTYHNEGFSAGGGLYLVPADPEAGEPTELVASPAGQILDCDLSYDGKVVLFSWREQEDEGYHLWTINVDGSGMRQLTKGEWHDYNGCWLPDGGIAFVSTRNAQFAYCWNSPVGVVHRMDSDGSNVIRLSANYLNDFTPYPLEDGRLIYSRWEYVDKPAIPIQSLWTIHTDGTGLAGYYGNRVISPGTFMEARSIPGSSLIICTMTGHNGPARGAIGVIDSAQGVNAQEAIWNVTPDVPVPKVGEGNGNFAGSKLYCTPVPLGRDRFLVSARGPVLVRTLSGSCSAVALAKPAKGLQWFSAQPVRPRPRPRVLSTTKNVAPDLGNSAYLVLQDIYDGLEPQVKRGEIKRLRVVRELAKTVRIHPDKRAFGFQFPVISAGATYAGKQVLGEVEVETDGSAFFEVPAGMPLYFMALDAQGRAVQRMRTFTHLMPGEVQGCIGCHESRNRTASLTASPTATKRSYQKLQPPEWGVGGFDYAAIVQPVLDRYCVECHSGPTPDKGVDLSGDKTDFFNVSYETLARGRKRSGDAQYESPYVSWIPTYNGFEKNILQVAPKTWGSPKSKLADLILANHPDAQGKPQVKMDKASQRRILAWIDLNVPYYGSSETAYPEERGNRRIYPAKLDETLRDVAGRRCATCHEGGKIPRPFWTRITNPHLNGFLVAPLAKSAGGSEACGKVVFQSTKDPDYQALLKTFEPVLIQLTRTPRLDMPGAKANPTVNRSCK